MGIYDREYYREDTPKGFDVLSGWSATTWLVVANAAVFLLNMLTDDWVVTHLKATPHSLTRPFLWWQLVTYGFVHDPESISHLFWNMFGLWMFGQAVEGIYGSREYLRFYLCGILLGGVFWSARMLAVAGGGPVGLMGASGSVTAVTLLFCIHYPKQTIRLMMVLPVPAWFLGVLIILINIQGALSGVPGTAFDVHLVGAALAIAYYQLGWNFGRWTPDWNWNWLQPQKIWKRRRFKIHRPPADEVEDDDEDHLEVEADRLLEKINRDGIDSLTTAERATLERHSRRMRDKRR